MSIQVLDVSKRFGTFEALHGVSLQIEPGELVALLGPSGSGKTTLLRVIAGLEVPDSGRILLDGQDSTEKRVQEREVGFVFQHYALFRHMTIFENVAFGLRVRPRAQRPSNEAIRDKVTSLLKLIQLDWVAERYPHQLSGGQRQRIALARALAIEPKVLLLDEPFGALDAKVRRELRRWLRRLHDEIHLTSVFVTHDQEEALEVADRIVVVNRGRIEQVGTPGEVYDHPATPFVYQFLGNVNLFEGRITRGIADVSGRRLAAPEHDNAVNALATAYVRPHDIDVAVQASENAVPATVDHAVALGSVVRLELSRKDNGEVVEVEIPRDRYEGLKIAHGDLVYLAPRRARFFLKPTTNDPAIA
jgi:sulfate/thiosulfate transport system ATP-binding protein